MESVLLPSLIVLFASLLQTCTGFGFAIFATPFLLFFYPAQTAIQLNIILSIVLSLLMVPKVRDDVDRVLLGRLVKGSIPGAAAGIGVFVLLNVDLLRLVIGIVVLSLSALLILRFRINAKPAWDFAAGAISGLFTTSLGMPGVPLLLYFSGTELDKATLRSTTLSFFLFIYAVALAMQMLFASTNDQIWFTALALLPSLVVGMLLGQILFRHINQEMFRYLTLFILLATGGYLVLSSLLTRGPV
jgi:uncharacterized protein